MRIRFDRKIMLQTGVIALLIFTGSAPALAQNSDVNARLSRIENEIQTLSRAMFKGEAPPPGSFGGGDAAAQAQMNNRISQIEQDLRSLTGKVEEMMYEVNRLKTLSANQQAQLPAPQIQTPPVQTGAGGMWLNSSGQPPMAASQAAGQSVMSDPNAPAPYDAPTTGHLGAMSSRPDTATASYESAFARLQAQDYAGAQAGFESFIQQNPDHPLVSNAMYWLGETFYVRNDFDRAMRIFAESYQKYPKGSKAPDNLLKLGMSLAALGKTSDACIALRQLKKEYPAGAAPVLTRADQEIQRLNCGAA
jgi:tol-pal system protein YbgF